MSSIDERVVSMKFDNKQFEAGVKQTLATLNNLNKGLKLDGATKGLNGISAAAKGVNLGHIGSAVDSIAGKFRALGVVAVTAIGTITTQAVQSAQRLVKSITLEPILKGLREYETNLNSIQTILANTGLEGKAGLQQVTGALDELNRYSDQTIYNFSEMAKNIGTFTAAGVKLDVATGAIKGIANLAAVSGSNAQQASAAMYQLSQALAAGRLTLIDWNSVVNAGLGGKVFQESLKETARVHGVAVDQIIKDAGSFRGSLEKGWITGEILTETLNKFTGDLNAQQLKTMGYNEEQIAGILKMGKVAQDAATKVKTVSQLIGTLQEAAGSGWARTWQLIFGDFEEARTLFSNVNNVLGGFIQRSADARNKVLGDWKALGGRKVLIEGIALAFNFLMEVITPIGKAFRDIFPATTGRQLYALTVTMRDFFSSIRLGEDTMTNLRRTFAGVFAILGIGLDVVKGAVSLLFRLFGVVTEGSGGFLEATANIGDFFVGLRKALQEGKGIEAFFGRFGDILEVPIRLLKDLGSFLGSLFDGFNGEKAAGQVSDLAKQLDPIGRLGGVIATVWGKVISVLDNVWDVAAPLAIKLGNFLAKFGTALSDLFGDMDLTLGGLGGLLAGGGLAALFASLASAVGNVGGIFNTLTDSLGTMQNTLRAVTLLQIATALGILTLSVVALSKIDVAGLTRALTAIVIMFGQLFGLMLIFEKLAGFTGLAKMPLVALALIGLGLALRVLVESVEALSKLDWEGLAKGLTGVTVLLGALILATRFMPPASGLISTGLGLIILAGAIRLLAESVDELSGLSWEEMAKGLVGVGVLLGALTLFTKFAGANKAGLLSGAGILLLAVGIKILADALEDFAKFSWEEIARGLVAMAGGLTLMAAALILIPPSSLLSAAAIFVTAASLGLIADALQDMSGMKWDEIGRGMTVLAGALTLIAAALILIPPTSLLSAAAVLVVAASLGMIGDALKDMSKMGWEEIAKGLVVLAGALTIIAAAVTVMTTALPGAAALLVVAASLAILAPVLLLFGKMEWEEIAKGMVVLAGAFTIIGLAGLLLTPVVPTLIGLGVAITLLGVGMAAAGVGLLAFSAGLTALSVSGAAGAVAIVGIVSALAGLIPLVMTQIANGIIAFAKVIGTAGPAMTKAMTAIILALVAAINKTSPKVIETLLKMLQLFLTKMLQYAPKLTDTALRLLVAFLNGIARNIGKVVTAAVSVAVAFLNGISKNLPRIIQAGVNLIINFVNGVANALRNNRERINAAGRNLGSAIIQGIVSGMAGGIGAVASKAREVASAALNAAKNFLGISSPSKEFAEVGKWMDLGMVQGLNKFSKVVTASAEDVGNNALEGMKKSLSKVSGTIGGDIDVRPTIRPVLDLTDVKKGASKITTMLPTKPIEIRPAYSSAVSTLRGFTATQASLRAQATPPPTEAKPVVQQTFNQTNNSPKALSPAEIYRQTKNQLSVAKGVMP